MKRLMPTAVLALLITISANATPAIAQLNFGSGGGFNNGNGFNGNAFNGVSDQLRSIDKRVDGVVKNVQFFLQANGRWAPMPQGKDAALCVTLEALKNGLKQARKAADNNDSNKLMNQMSQLSVISQNAVSASQQAGIDARTTSQLMQVQNDLQVTASLAASGSAVIPPNTFPNTNGIATSGLSLVNTQLVGPNQLQVSWRERNGQVSTYMTQVGSFMLTNGATARPALGDEVNLLNVAYSQAQSMTPGGFTPSYPNGFRPVQQGVLQTSSGGRGQLVMLGQVFMNIKSTTISAADPVRHRGILTIAAGRDAISFMGTLNNQSPSSVTFNVDSCDRGPASGSIIAAMNANGTLTGANGNGVLNGQAFNITFRSN